MKQYNIIVADPPWPFRVWSEDTGHERSAERHYPTMSIDDLCALPVQSIAADDCALLLWATHPTLPDALRLGAAWGFEYTTCAFMWLKLTPTGKAWHTGMGYYSRANTEPCYLFTRGNPLARVNRGVHQIIDTYNEQMPLWDTVSLVARVGRHSQKPEMFYHNVEKLFGDLPRVELFSRIARPGWDCIGNEIDGKQIQDVLKEGVA